MNSSVIVLELNELAPALMDRFISQGHLPGFARLRRESITAVTDAEQDPPFLEPWIQWVTVHTGLPFAEHRVFNLGDGPRCTAPRVWDIVADAGRRAWVCGSMNAVVRSRNPNNVFIVPDPWAIDIEPHPTGFFDPYIRLVRAYVREYTRDKLPLSRGDYLRFVRFMLAHGISLQTIVGAVRQLASELQGVPRWRRAAILDRLQWDLFRYYQRKLQPTLSTFFLNSTAHFQHFYWRNLDPDLFEVRDPPERQAANAGAVLFGYRKMDRLVQEAIALAHPETTVVFCTALGAQPLTKYDEEGGKQILRITDIDALMLFVGVSRPYRFVPAMSDRINVVFETETAAETAMERLRSLQMVSGEQREQVLMVRQNGSSLFAGVKIMKSPLAGTELRSRFADAPKLFSDFFYLAQDIKSGMHHSDGLLWIRRPDRRHVELQEKVSLRQIAPTLLALCDMRAGGRRFAFPPLAQAVVPELA
jgi:hypothetical protein